MTVANNEFAHVLNEVSPSSHVINILTTAMLLEPIDHLSNMPYVESHLVLTRKRTSGGRSGCT
jgi:hypothetical protein